MWRRKLSNINWIIFNIKDEQYTKNKIHVESILWKVVKVLENTLLLVCYFNQVFSWWKKFYLPEAIATITGRISFPFQENCSCTLYTTVVETSKRHNNCFMTNLIVVNVKTNVLWHVSSMIIKRISCET